MVLAFSPPHMFALPVYLKSTKVGGFQGHAVHARFCEHLSVCTISSLFKSSSPY